MPAILPDNRALNTARLKRLARRWALPTAGLAAAIYGYDFFYPHHPDDPQPEVVIQRAVRPDGKPVRVIPIYPPQNAVK